MHNPELKLAFEFVENTNRNIFLTGKAGTGKTTFLHKLKEVSPKRMVVVAPTGVAAINAGGVTIHSFFQMPFGPILPNRLDAPPASHEKNQFIRKFNKRKINIIRSLDLLVIDEISMVRADLLDGIDNVLRKYKNKTLPFGGVQLLMIGDLQQLAPVVKEHEWNLLRSYYETVFFFSSKAFQQSLPISVELKHIYRQQDDKFIKILNEIREDKLSDESVSELQKRYKKDYLPDKDEGYITLTTHNASASRINEEQLKKVTTKVHTFKAEVKDHFPEHAYPAEEFLKIKTGSQVMFIKNDSSPEKRYYNGKIGIITDIDNDGIYVKCKNEDDSIHVEQEMWENIKYTINDRSKEIEEDVAGSFIQYPLRLAWAITIHKSQGLTFEKAIIDAQAAFAHGQTYVALSRCKTMEGLILSSPIKEEGIICDSTVSSFNQNVEENQPDEKVLLSSKQTYQLALLEELFNYRQLQYHIDKCKKVTDENLNIIQGNLQEKTKLIMEKGIFPLNAVARKFNFQLKQLSSLDSEIEKNVQLQDRIKKAARYFLEETEKNIVLELDESYFETDNKEIRKSVNKVLLKIRELLHVKQTCLVACKNGFVTKDYLHVRAVAILEKPTKKQAKQKTVQSTSTEHPELYERLKAWRAEIAEETNQKHYLIAHQKLLVAISNELPGNTSQLKAIKGMGKQKLKTFSEDILRIVHGYCTEFKLQISDLIIEENMKTPKKSTKEVSMELFRDGHTVKQIAKLRKVTERTIEGHLAFYVGTGELLLKQFLDARTISIITNYFEENPKSGLNLAKENLANSITISEIKFVMAHLEYMENE